MDCMTEMVSETLQALGELPEGKGQMPPRVFLALCYEIAFSPEQDRPALIDTMGEILSKFDRYRNPPKAYAEVIWIGVQECRAMLDGHV